MIVVKDNGGKAALEEMAGPAPAGVDKVGVAAVSFADGTAEAVALGGLQDQVDVIGHQAVGPHGDAGFGCLFGEQVEIDFVVAVLKEDGLAAVSALGHMMRKAWNDDTSESRHAETIAFLRGIGIMSPYFGVLVWPQ